MEVDIGTLRLHPDAERVPLADAGDMSALRSSLAEHGQQDPVDVTPDWVLLDGRTRWTLLQELGALTIKVRIVDLPVEQQTHYVIDRALARRHLTMGQKKALNDLLRTLVIEVREPSETTAGRGRPEPMRIGYSQTHRAEKLGVERQTIQNWDAEADLVDKDLATRDGPTHAIDKRGRPQPLRKREPAEVPLDRAPQRRTPARPAPIWTRHLTTWCRRVLPEDRPHLLRMSKEIHSALGLLGLSCETEENRE